MTLKTPLFRLVVEPFKFEDWDPERQALAKAGFALPEPEDKRNKESVDMGTVVAIGPSAFKEYGFTTPSDVVKVGDVIAYARHSGKKVKDPYTEKEHLVINDEDLVMVFVKEK